MRKNVFQRVPFRPETGRHCGLLLGVPYQVGAKLHRQSVGVHPGGGLGNGASRGATVVLGGIWAQCDSAVCSIGDTFPLLMSPNSVHAASTDSSCGTVGPMTSMPKSPGA